MAAEEGPGLRPAPAAIVSITTRKLCRGRSSVCISGAQSLPGEENSDAGAGLPSSSGVVAVVVMEEEEEGVVGVEMGVTLGALSQLSNCARWCGLTRSSGRKYCVEKMRHTCVTGRP